MASTPTTPRSESTVAATLRRRAEVLAAAGVLLAAAALALADARLAYPAQVTARFLWPASLPEITAAGALLGSLLTGLAAARAGTRGVSGIVSWVAVGVLAAGIYWMSMYSNSSCSEHLCSGLIGRTANWWAFWSLTAAAAGCAVLACRVGESLGRS